MVSMSSAKPEPRPLPKRFYQQVAVQHSPAGFCILLDGKPVRTPARKTLHCASQHIAQQMAEEWAIQREVIATETMPFTRLISVILDRAEADRDAWLTDMGNYLETDLLYYRTPATDAWGTRMAALQSQHFDPVLDWLATTHQAPFHTTEGLMAIAQPEASLAQLRACFAKSSDTECACLAMLTPILGSALLAFARWQRHLAIDDALAAARIEETVHAEHYGDDAESLTAWAAKCRDARAAAQLLLHREN